MNNCFKQYFIQYLSGVTVGCRSYNQEANSRLGHHQVAATWMDDYLQTGKPSHHITNTKVNSAFHPSGAVNQVSACLVGVKVG